MSGTGGVVGEAIVRLLTEVDHVLTQRIYLHPIPTATTSVCARAHLSSVSMSMSRACLTRSPTLNRSSVKTGMF